MLKLNVCGNDMLRKGVRMSMGFSQRIEVRKVCITLPKSLHVHSYAK